MYKISHPMSWSADDVCTRKEEEGQEVTTTTLGEMPSEGRTNRKLKKLWMVGYVGRLVILFFP
jgi:hypothetical protein